MNEDIVKKAIVSQKEELRALIKSEKPLDDEEKTSRILELALDPPGAIDVLEAGGELLYLTKNNIVKEIEDDIISFKFYVPPPKEQCQYLFPQKDEVKKFIKDWNESENIKLYNDLLSYHISISDLPDSDYYHLLVLWDIHTWLIEKCHFSPFLYFYAVKERGKTRTVKSLIYLARRGIFTETIREPDIIRWGNDHKAAIGFDAKDFPKKIVRANCEDLILCRFERGAIASRTLWPERGAFNDTKIFKLYGPTVIASNRPVDDILESRSIAIDMKPTNKTFENPVTPESALLLKNRLAAFRFVHFKKELIKANKPAKGRLGDIISPLYSIMLTFYPDKKDIFMRLIDKIQNNKTEEALDTFEAKIINTVIKLKDRINNGKLSIDEITIYLNEVEKIDIGNQTVGKILKALGFDKTRMTGGKRGIFYDSNLINKLMSQYGVSEDSDDSDDSERDINDNVINQLLNF